MMSILPFRLLNVLEVIAPFKHFNKLREFVQMKLPPGFPVKLGKVVLTFMALFFRNVCAYSCSVLRSPAEFWRRTLT